MVQYMCRAEREGPSPARLAGGGAAERRLRVGLSRSCSLTGRSKDNKRRGICTSRPPAPEVRLKACRGVPLRINVTRHSVTFKVYCIPQSQMLLHYLLVHNSTCILCYLGEDFGIQ